jgi:hypothetical protein
MFTAGVIQPQSVESFMVMETGIVRKIFLCVLLLGAPLFGQDREPAAAVAGPAVEASVGYVYFSMAGPSSQRDGLNGVDANGLMQFNPHWGATADFSYAHGSNAFGTGHDNTVLSALAGPVFYLAGRGRTKIFVHALAGIAWVDSAVPVSPTTYLAGWEDRFSYAAGGGVEHNFSGPFALRGVADYQRTTFVNSLDATQNRNNLRLTMSIVYRFGNR